MLRPPPVSSARASRVRFLDIGLIEGVHAEFFAQCLGSVFQRRNSPPRSRGSEENAVASSDCVSGNVVVRGS